MESKLVRTFKLNPVCGQKSFYGKAVVEEYSSGLKRLYSYEKHVADIDGNGNFHRVWNGYSDTTMKHINAFIEHYGIKGGGKKWWMSLESTENWWSDHYVVVKSNGFFNHKFRVVFDDCDDAEAFAKKLRKQNPMCVTWVEEIEKAG